MTPEQFSHLTLDAALALTGDAMLDLQSVALEVTQEGSGYRVRWATPNLHGEYVMDDPRFAQQQHVLNRHAVDRFLTERWLGALDSHEWEAAIWWA